MSKDTRIAVVNPYTGETVGDVPRGLAAEVDTAADVAKRGSRIMRAMSLHERSGILAAIGRSLLDDIEPMAQLIVSEAGKTIREARAEVVRAAGIFQYASEETRRLHGETLPFDAFPNGEGRTGYWVREPVGVVGAITPWNVPLALTAHKIAPAFGAGNAVIHKPAEQTPLNALRLRGLAIAAGLPAEAYTIVTGLGEEAGDAIVRHHDIPFVTFTGSREVGTKLPGRAGYKRIALELGGNSPLIVMPSADLDAAAEAVIRNGFAVAGQLCISVQRVIAHSSILQDLERQIVAGVQRLRYGDPALETTDVGPLINREAAERVSGLVSDAVACGARCAAGGRALTGAMFEPTVLSQVPDGAKIRTDEAFGPIVATIACDSLEDAVRIANETPYGLNAAVFTNDLREAHLAARDIAAGSVMINESPSFRSDLMPYGGRRQSGIGREGVRFAMEEMTELKVVCYGPMG